MSMEFSRQEHWSGLPFPPPGDLPEPGIKPGSPASQADSLPYESPVKPDSFRCKVRLRIFSFLEVDLYDYTFLLELLLLHPYILVHCVLVFFFLFFF